MITHGLRRITPLTEKAENFVTDPLRATLVDSLVGTTFRVSVSCEMKLAFMSRRLSSTSAMCMSNISAADLRSFPVHR